LYDTETFELLIQIPNGGRVIKFSLDGRLLAVGDGYCYACGADESSQVGFAHLWAVAIPK
jgi:hypothetical protein